MSPLAKKALAIVLIYLTVSPSLISPYLITMVLAEGKGETWEEFIQRARGELEAAIPPDSDPVKEYEYVAPEGFNPSKAGELWELLETSVSLGETSAEMARRLGGSIVETDVNGKPVKLNISALSVEKYWDGSVEVRIPIISDEAFNYTHSRATARILYEVWNSTRVRYYNIKNLTALLNVTYRNLETNETLTRLIKPFMNTTVMLGDSAVTQGLSLNITVPEHSQELVTLIPEHAREFTVLFPKYRIKVEVMTPISLPNGSAWLVGGGVWRPWFPVGSEVVVTICGVPNDPNASYPYSDWIKEPLNAIVRIGSCEGFQVVGYDALHLTTSQPYGHFTLKAVKPGNHSVVLEVEGNAVFEDGSKDHTLSIEVLGPEHPCITITILNVAGSLPGFVNITFRVKNIGGSPTKAWFFPTYFDWDNELLDALPLIWAWGPRYYLGVLQPGGSVDYTYTCLLAKHAVFEIIIIYGYFPPSFISNTYLYLNYAPLWITGEEYLIAVPEYRDVPEHYDKLLVMIPVHEEKLNITIPGYRSLMRIRLHSLGVNTFENMLRSMLNGKNMTAIFMLGETLLEGTLAPLSLTIPVLGVELEAGEKSLGEDVAGYVMERVEQCFEDIGLVSEDQACSLLGVTRSMLRSGEVPEGFDVAFAYEAWVNSSKILLNSTQLAIYNHTVSEYIRRNNLQDDLRLCWRRVTNLTEVVEPSNKSGNLTLIYRPLSTYGGELVRTVRVRNYAKSTMNYKLRVERYDATVMVHMEILRRLITQSQFVDVWLGYLTLIGLYGSAHQLMKEEVEIQFEVGKGYRDALMVSKTSADIIPTYFVYFIELVYGSKIVAMVAFQLVYGPDPFWQGFLDGLILDKGLGVAMSVAVLIISALAPEITPVLLAISMGLKAFQFFTSQGPMLLNAFFTIGNLTLLATMCEANAMQCHLAGKYEFAAKALNLSRAISAKAMEVAVDTGLQLFFGISLDDVKIVLGQKNASRYESGRAWGRVIGTIVECVAYVTTFTILYDRLTSSASVGQLSVKSILTRVGRGLYNWVTPAVWDLAEFGVRVGAWVKGKLDLRDVSNVLFADQVHKGFGETVDRAFKTLPDGGEPETIVKGVSEIVDKTVLDKEVPETIGKRMLNILKTVGEAYAGDREWGEKVKNAADNIVEAWKRVKGLEAWKTSGEPGGLLTDWLEKTPREKVEEVVETIKKLSKLDSEELKNLGGALAKVGDSFENGFKLFDTYFKITDDSIKNYFLDTIENAKENVPKILDTWLRVIPENGFVLTVKEYSDGQRFIHLPKFIADAYSIKQGDIITVIVDDIRVTGVVYEYEEGGLAVALRKGASNILNIKEGAPLGIVTSKVLALVTEDEGFTVSALGEKGSRVDRAITDILRKLNAFESREGSVILVEIQRISGDNTLIPETRRDLRLWKPDRYIRLPVDDWDGPFYVRIKPFTVDDMENALSIVRDGSGNPLIIRQGDGFKFFEQDLDFEYNDRGMLRAILDVSGTQRKIAIDIYCNEQCEVDTKFAILESDLWYNAKKYQISDKKVFTISNGKRVLNKMVRVIEFEYSSKNNLLMLYYDPDENALKPFKIGAPAQYDDYYRVTRDAISFLEDKVPSICFEGESGSIEIYIHDFEERHKYLRSILNSQGEGVFATQVLQIGLKKAGLRTIIDITGENIEFEGIIYSFDIMDDPNRITLAIEVKSEWSESHPGRGLENAAKQLVKHAEKLKNSERLATDHGYAVYISIFPDKIEIHWKRVNIEG